MSTADFVRQSACPQDWLVSIDLRVSSMFPFINGKVKASSLEDQDLSSMFFLFWPSVNLHNFSLGLYCVIACKWIRGILTLPYIDCFILSKSSCHCQFLLAIVVLSDTFAWTMQPAPYQGAVFIVVICSIVVIARLFQLGNWLLCWIACSPWQNHCPNSFMRSSCSVYFL